MELKIHELDLLRQWFNALCDVNIEYLNEYDKKLADKIIDKINEECGTKHSLSKRVINYFQKLKIGCASKRYKIQGTSFTTNGKKWFEFDEKEFQEFKTKRFTHYPAWSFDDIL